MPDGRIVAVGSGATVIYSDNYGNDWEIIYVPDSISRLVRFNRVDFADNLHGMAVGSYYSIIKTNDGGVTWTDISPGAEYHYFTFTDVSYSDVSSCFIAGSYWGDPFLLHSADGGSSWDTAFHTSEWEFSRIQFVDENTGFLSGADSNYFFKSTDGGENWEQVTVDPEIEGLSLGFSYFIDENTGFAGGFNDDDGYKLYKTTDQGWTWMRINANVLHYVESSGQVEFVNDSTGYIVGDIGYDTSCNILVSYDLGETWKMDTLAFLRDFNGVHFVDEQEGVIVGENSIIFKTITGGLVNIPEPQIYLPRGSVWYCYPNPFTNQANISSTEEIKGNILIRIYDLTGRAVRNLSANYAPANESFFTWDGRDDNGNYVSPGIYTVCVDHGSSREAMKIIKF